MDAGAFIKAVDHIAAEKSISREVIFEAMELALATAYKKNFNALTNVRVDLNRKTGEIKVFSILTVVEKIEEEEINDEVEEQASEEILEEEVETKLKEELKSIVKISLEEARKKVPNIKVGETIEEEITPKDFGRVAASTAKQVVMQKIREAERISVMDEFEGKQDELVVGLASREDALNYYIDLGRIHGILPKKEVIPGETIIMGNSLKVYIVKVENTPKGPKVLLSRTHYGFVKRLLELEIPELHDGEVVLYSIAREAGVRSKIAVYSENRKIDAIGSCIGEHGERIERILKELKGEKIDLILYDKDPATFIKNALSPARNISVYITDEKRKEAIVVADGENLSLAIGRKGQNVRLATKLTHYHLNIKTTEEMANEGINIKTEGNE
ncbi:MAG: transcription termination factor NusA [Bacilli bacterium]|nr:transcription termination factor NusA [Bacilli bacterium]MDD3304538.1 transcription termination factor NusA [Bacilli bacterium]MDD4411287.1 transcription termination factor NusA [Bacilli bacterium]